MRWLLPAVLVLAACDGLPRLTWYPIYPLPGETAITSERTLAILAYGVVEDPPCDEPARLPRARIRDVERGAWIETHARCEDPYVHFVPRRALAGAREYELHVAIDPDDDWDVPVFGTEAVRDGDVVSFAFSTARRPEILRAVWSGEHAYVLFSQDIGDDVTPTIAVRGELGGPEPVPVHWWSDKQGAGACDQLQLGCEGNYFSRQHRVIVAPPVPAALVVAGAASDGTPFGPIRVEPER